MHVFKAVIEITNCLLQQFPGESRIFAVIGSVECGKFFIAAEVIVKSHKVSFVSCAFADRFCPV